MIKKHILSNIRRFLFYSGVSFKKFHFPNEFFMNFWQFIQTGWSNTNSYPSQKSILNYITSRNMRRTLTPSDFMNENKIQMYQRKLNISSRKETPEPVSLILEQTKKYFLRPAFLNFLKFHSKSMLSGNLLSQQFSKKETQEELEISWGGPEIFKLITFIKDFDEVINKNSEVLVFFSAYWCHHCMRLRKPYGTAAQMAKKANLPVLFASFDVTTDPDVALENGVVGIPLIKYFKNGKLFSTYKGKRTAEDLFEFVKNPSLQNDTKKSNI